MLIDDTTDQYGKHLTSNDPADLQSVDELRQKGKANPGQIKIEKTKALLTYLENIDEHEIKNIEMFKEDSTLEKDEDKVPKRMTIDTLLQNS